jgi:cytochrome oxidase Cu insertion factor (SCO1/SenC/PrrC family)
MRRRQRRKWRLLVVAVLGLLVAAIVGYLGWNLGWTAAAEGDQAPTFVLPDHQGRQVALADYLGRKPVLLVFYMTYG